MTKERAQQIIDLQNNGQPQPYKLLLEAIQTLAKIHPPSQ